MNVIRLVGIGVAVGFLTGCEQPAQPPQQHSELQRISREERKIVPRVTDRSPIRFDQASVETVGPNNSTLGSRSSWEPTVPVEDFLAHFFSEVAKTKPTAPPERLSALVFRCRYWTRRGRDRHGRRHPISQSRARVQGASSSIPGINAGFLDRHRGRENRGCRRATSASTWSGDAGWRQAENEEEARDADDDQRRDEEDQTRQICLRLILFIPA